MPPDLQTTLDDAQQIARQAGAVLVESYQQPHSISFKGNVDLVTQADEASERLIVAALRKSYPDHTIIAEEGGTTAGSSDYVWIVDPLDGTTNYAHSFPFFAVSIALRGPDGLLAGVVFDPLRDECFAATRGHGATLNGVPIQVTGESKLQRSLLGTGFPYDRHTAADNNSQLFARFLRKAQGVRRAGAAALDLAYVACGRLDAYWERGPQAWDMAAGILLVREAGGHVTDYDGAEDTILEGTRVVSSNGLLHDELLAVIAEASRQDGFSQ